MRNPETITHNGRTLAVILTDEQPDLRGAVLSDAYLPGYDLNGAYLNGACLNGANLNGANLNYAWLHDASLRGARLNGANLRGAHLTHADLTDVWLVGADLSHARLSHANLNGANLTGARLTNAELTGARLTNADLSNADLTNADLSCSEGFEWAAVGPIGTDRRTITAVVIDGEPVLFAGCWRGTLPEFKAAVNAGGHPDWEWPDDNQRLIDEALAAARFFETSLNTETGHEEAGRW